MKNIKLTKDGLMKLKEEYENLKNSKRPEAVDRLKSARGMGDLAENGEYAAAKDELNLIEERIKEIEEILKNAEVVEDNHNNHEVSLGSTVTVKTEGKQESFLLVGEYESDPLQKKLSVTSPIGKALLGQKIGNTVEVEVPAGKITYKILEIK